MPIHAGVKKNHKNYQPKKTHTISLFSGFLLIHYGVFRCLRETHGPLLRRGKLGTGNEKSPLSRNLGQRLTNSNPVLHVRGTPRGVRKNSEKSLFHWQVQFHSVLKIVGKSSLVRQK